MTREGRRGLTHRYASRCAIPSRGQASPGPQLVDWLHERRSGGDGPVVRVVVPTLADLGAYRVGSFSVRLGRLTRLTPAGVARSDPDSAYQDNAAHG